MLEMDRGPKGDCRGCQASRLSHTVLERSVAADWDCHCSAPTSSLETCFWAVPETELWVSLSFSFIQFLQHQLMYELIGYGKIHIIVNTSALKHGCSISLNLHVFHSFWPDLYEKTVPGKIYCRMSQPIVQTPKAYLHLTVLNFSQTSISW